MKINVDIPLGLTADFDYNYGRDETQVFAVLSFGTAEIARWDISDQQAEFDPDYYTLNNDEREQHQRDWLGRYVAQHLSEALRLGGAS